MKAWVTGAGGFIGVHLVNYLIEKNYRILATHYNPTTDINGISKKAIINECDIRDREKVFSFMREFMPDKIFHLAAQSYPTVSWENPWYTLESNVIGTINIFEAVKHFNKKCKILNAGSSGEYGYVSEEEVPIHEDRILKPLHPYGVSKVAQELLANQYFQNFEIPSITIRIFNTTGPRKVSDVCSDFTKRLIEIEKGINKGKKLRVGNLKTKRAITDVRDLTRAFDLALDKATIGETYNVSGEKVYEINEIVNILRNLVNFKFEIWQDPSLIRTTDEPIIYGDSSKFKKETGWEQEIQLEKTLKDMLDYWREVL
ncbi:GDP-mannose 4,6-dehydratase [Candidatus Pacearchaeota archaeon]|nr:GDP-mannose 4,6-dehydratase [Candidatus Pacearchaeota archaeon]